MPYQWVDADVAFEHKGVKVYRVYKNDFVGEGARLYHYGWSPDCSDEDPDSTFDVRDLAKAMKMPVPETYEDIKKVLYAAIDAGILTQEGVRL
jgi:hypothetical protein